MSDHGMMGSRDRLIYMADQIARNFAALGHDNAVKALADHIDHYWDPRMKAQIFEISPTSPASLSLTVAAALAWLQAGPVTAQTPANQFNSHDQSGHCDVG
jgi:formate dehydrogenase subunit delta